MKVKAFGDTGSMMSKKFQFTLWFLAILTTMIAASKGYAQPTSPRVVVVSMDGPLTPALVEYLARGIRSAEQSGAELLVFQINTPGGGVDLMQNMVEAIRASSVPVVVYVTPRGAMAGSAGTVITVAGHIAAMAPETAIGAASPVGPGGEELGETIAAKEKNILKATVRSLAERRGLRAVALAESTIETAEAASANEALDVGLVDYIANDLEDLLQQMDGTTVQMPDGERTIHTANAQIETVTFSFIELLLNMLTNPNIVFLLLTIGVQAILIEISSPGGWVAGFIGAVCLALAAYGIGVLPVNWFGIVFLILAFALFILDIKAPTHGALTAAGVGSLIVGALVLFNSPNVPAFQRVSVPLVVGMSLITGATFFVILLFALRAQHTPIRMGQESLAGRTGTVRSVLDPVGTVQLGGELWTAEAEPGETDLPAGTRVRVTRAEGIRLFVKKVS
jgi:membrane-bound serine protease (ClpP class)